MESRKKAYRREYATKARQDRTMIAYLEVKYPEVYEDAVKYYNTLNQKYPSKLDLRKTDEFYVLKSTLNGEISNSKSRRTYPNITEITLKSSRNDEMSTAKITHTPVNNPGINDNMVLNIQLMQFPETPKPSDQEIEQTAAESSDQEIEQTAAESSDQEIEQTAPESSDQEIERIMHELRQDPSLERFFLNLPAEIPIDPIETTIETTIDNITPTITEEIPQAMIDGIVSELEKDDDLEKILNYEMDVDIEIPSTSPLEDELLSW